MIILHYTIAVKQFINTSEFKSYFSELFEISSIIPNQPINLCLEEKLYKKSGQKLKKYLWKSS